jgi:hypothetical protein
MMRFLLLLFVVAHASLAGRASAASAAKVSDDEKRQLAARVVKIFEAKCADCHGSHLPKPKGKFGYVLDLQRMADNADYIVRGEPEKSDLYQMIKKDEMPGEDADVPALTPEEKEAVEKWVLIGAPAELPAGVSTGNPEAAPERASVSKVPFLQRVMNWLGKFHPLSTHFPVALLMTAVLAEAVAWFLKRNEWMLLVRFLVVLGALSSVPTTVLGWLAEYPLVSGSQLATIYRFHQILGTATCAWALVCAVLVCISECEEGSLARSRFRGALLLGAFLVSVVGFLGGALSAGGLDHYKF